MSWLRYGGAVGCARDGLSAAVARLRVCVCYLWVVNFFFWGGADEGAGIGGEFYFTSCKKKLSEYDRVYTLSS